MRVLALALALAFAAPAARAVGPDTFRGASEPDYQEAVRLIRAQEYSRALPLLRKLDAAFPAEPAVLTWLGFAYRKVKAYETAKGYYAAALAADAWYRPAIAYQGQWFVETGDIPSAKANLARLRQICAACEETKDLEQALEKAGR
jgi:predicted Zn-dependent protease